MDNPLFFLAVIVAVIVLVALLPRWIRRSNRSAAGREQRRIAGPRVDGALEELGVHLRIHAAESVVREMVDAIALQQPRRFTVLGDGGYGIRFIEPDDAIVRLRNGAGGTLVRVERSREYLAMPSGSAFWSDLRARILGAAQTRGLAVDELRSRLEREDDGTGWVLIDDV